MKQKNQTTSEFADTQKTNRRRYLAGVAAGSVASLAVSTRISSAASDEGPQPNKPQYSDDHKKGYARGTFRRPVSPDTISEIQNRVLDTVRESSNKGGIAVIDPYAEPTGPKTGQKRILGFVFKWAEGSAHIYVREEPEIIGSPRMSKEKKRKEEKIAYKKIKEFLSSGVEG